MYVVGLDSSPSSAAARRWAAAEAQRLGGRILVIHAWEPEERLVTDVDAERYDVARKALDRAIETLAPTGLDVPVRVELRDGPAGPALVEAARDADLLVVGAGEQGRDAFGDPRGSVAAYCRAHAGCGTVVIEGPRSHPRPALSHS